MRTSAFHPAGSAGHRQTYYPLLYKCQQSCDLRRRTLERIRMGKIDENKKKKKETLFSSAYELFITKGINSTAISDIVEKAGVAKGTFYLYFKDKYDIRNKLIAHKTHELFRAAKLALDQESVPVEGLEDQLIFIMNHIIDTLVLNVPLLNFISKNLVMGALRSALLTGERTDHDFYEVFLDMVRQDKYEYEDVDVMLFTIVELAGSAGYNSILYKEPLPIEQYKPFLYRSVRLILESHRYRPQPDQPQIEATCRPLKDA